MPEQWTAAQYNEHFGRDKPKKKKSKWNNVGIMTPDGWFDSKAEYRVWLDRKTDAMSTSPTIRNLRRQVPYELRVEGELIETYYADFVYDRLQADGSWQEVVEDVKGPKRFTSTFNRKRKWMLSIFGIVILITRVKR